LRTSPDGPLREFDGNVTELPLWGHGGVPRV